MNNNQSRFVATAKIVAMTDRIVNEKTGTPRREITAVLTTSKGSDEQTFTVAGKVLQEVRRKLRVGRNIKLAFVRTYRGKTSSLAALGEPRVKAAAPAAAA